MLIICVLRSMEDNMQKEKQWLTETVITHRGLHDNKVYPENSLGAFEQAIEHGYGIEFDLYLTKDGEVIVHHDLFIKRTCGKKGAVTKIDTSKLEEYKLYGTEYSIPRFKDVLKLVDGKVDLVIEIKRTHRVKATCEKIWDILKDYKGKYCIESFDINIVKWWHKHHPEIILGQLCDTYLLHKLEVRACRHYRFADFYAVGIKNLPSKYYQKICNKNKDLTILTWTVRTPQDLELASHNADNFIFETNRKNPDYIPLPDKENTYCHRNY